MLGATAAVIAGLLTRVGLAIGAEPSAWYAPSFYVPLAAILALAAYAFRVALGPRQPWAEALIEG